jgi:hypothetical protein
LEVTEVVDGRIRGTVASFEGADTSRVDSRPQEVCDRAAEQLRRQLGAVSIAELVGKDKSK